MRRAVYVSGPLTSGPPGAYYQNTKTAIEVGDALWKNGFLPIVPHAIALGEFICPRPYEESMEYDICLVEMCDSLVRIPGESKGADREALHAQMLGIPIFKTALECYSAGPGCFSCQCDTPSWQVRTGLTVSRSVCTGCGLRLDI